MNNFSKPSVPQLPTRSAHSEFPTSKLQSNAESPDDGITPLNIENAIEDHQNGVSSFDFQFNDSAGLQTSVNIEGEANPILMEHATIPTTLALELTNSSQKTSTPPDATLVTDAPAQSHNITDVKAQDIAQHGVIQTNLPLNESLAKKHIIPAPLMQRLAEGDDITNSTGIKQSENLASQPALPRHDYDGKNSTLLTIKDTPAEVPLNKSGSQQTTPRDGPLSGEVKLETPLEKLPKSALVTAQGNTTLSHPSVQPPTLTPDIPSIEGSANLMDSLEKITLERSSMAGLTNQTNSLNAAKTVSPQIIVAPSNIHHPAVQTVATTLAQVGETQSGISIRLNPPEMGRVFLDFQFNTDRSVSAVVRSEIPETAALLKHNADFLLEALKDSGFNSVTLSFEQNDQSKNKGFNFDQEETSPMLYQSASSDPETLGNAPDITHRRQTFSNSNIDLKL